jgi:hypothetical protein
VSRAPELSVVLVTDELATVQTVLEHLGEQSASDRVEVVLVTPAERLELDPPLRERFAGVRVVRVPDIDALPQVRASGVHAATAPVVALGETHSYPQPGWAEALIEAHRGPWTAVGPTITNANPESAIAWANLLLDYGPWVDVEVGGPAETLPGHNSSFKRDVLLAYGARLGTVFESDTQLVADLLARGHSLYLEPRARTAHLNISQPGAWVRERLYAGRNFAAVRSANWPRRRRAVYALGSPLIPAVRLGRTVRHLREVRRLRLLARVLPALVVSLAFSATGEAMGYALGRGSLRRLYEMELHRVRYAS